VEPDVPLANGFGLSLLLLAKTLEVLLLLLDTAPKPLLFANEAKPPELGVVAAAPPVEKGLAPGLLLLLLLAKLENPDCPKAGALPLEPVAHGEDLIPSCEGCPNALGLPKAGEVLAAAPPNELEPNAGCEDWALGVPDAGVLPQGDAFWPICEDDPKAGATGEAAAPKAEGPAGEETACENEEAGC
jgi:hypothetical protein